MAINIPRKRARDYHYNRRYMERRRADPMTRNADRLIRRCRYLKAKKEGLGYTGDIQLAGLYHVVKGRWELADLFIDWQTAKATVHRKGLRWQNHPIFGEYYAYSSEGLTYQIVVKSAQAFHHALRADSRVGGE